MTIDVLVIGGGPGGAVCAAELARRGRSVVVLEKATFPRFHLGESLLPQSLPILEEIGVLAQVRAAFLPKYGARFHDDVGGRTERFSFDGAWRPIAHSFEVPRDAFDAILLDHARACGADVRERWKVDRIAFDASGRAVGVDAVSAAGTPERLAAAFVVDASGRDALRAHAAGTTEKIAGLDQTALFAHFAGVPRERGLLEGDIDIVLFDSGDPKRPNWFWFIPFKDGRTSVGAVASRAWLKSLGMPTRSSPEDPISPPAPRLDAGALFDAAVAASPTARRLLRDATCLWPKKEAAADFSYRVTARRGPGWLAVGDAGGFIDPLFSTGAHLAMVGGKLAAGAIVAGDEAALAAWEKQVHEASETFILAVTAFYEGPLVELLFVENKHTALRRSITSLLAGDVFTDSVWLRDTRMRLREMMRARAPST